MDYKNFDKDFDRIRKKYLNILERRYKAQNKYNEARIEANCSVCYLFDKNDGIKYSEWLTECDTLKKCKKVTESYLYFEKIAKEYLDIQEQYANVIFSNLSSYKPKLVERKNNKVLEWDDVFNSSNILVDEEMNKSLVALIEEDGGKYRILNY